MKNSLLIAIVGVIFLALVQPANAVSSKYLIRTSGKDIEFKKKQALKWHEYNYEKRKTPYMELQKDILKQRALRWYDNNVTKGKFYFVNADKELAFKKNKALKWYEKNSD